MPAARKKARENTPATSRRRRRVGKNRLTPNTVNPKARNSTMQ
jgi:hypothetical protein